MLLFKTLKRRYSLQIVFNNKISTLLQNKISLTVLLIKTRQNLQTLKFTKFTKLQEFDSVLTSFLIL